MEIPRKARKEMLEIKDPEQKHSMTLKGSVVDNRAVERPLCLKTMVNTHHVCQNPEDVEHKQ